MGNSIRTSWAVLSVLTAVTLWTYFPTFGDVVERWATNPLYSHGYLVPLFAAFVLWRRRSMLGGGLGDPSWYGVPCVLFGVLLHLAGAYFYFDWASSFFLLPVLAGLCLAAGGTKMLAWSWPAIAFLVFMLPLPYRLEVSLAYPLQRLATIASTYLLQTVGFPAVAEGNIIIMEEARIGVVEACAGLGMLVTFTALTTAVAMLLRRSLFDKIIIVLSALPIAIAANVVRIVVTGILAETIGNEAADEFFHGLFGYMMPAVALSMLWVEMKILAMLIVDAPVVNESTFGLAQVFSAKESVSPRGKVLEVR